jgi:quinohemoprotein ethanol dehydrogenase
MERAAKTWTGQWWQAGGGGTVWDGMAFDPELRLLFVGTGNGSPHPRWLRSPDGGDNLYLSSILALDPSTGEIVWHYQTTPGDSWDYTATQPLMLADLEIEGRLRQVIMQVPKNGFFFVLDRKTGEFLSADAVVEVTWATGFDETGRPIEGDSDYRHEPKFIKPSPYGVHSWPPMSFHPGTGLVYLPVRDMGSVFGANADWEFQPGYWNTGLDTVAFSTSAVDVDLSIEAFLLAWDPVQRREVWRVPHVTAFNGGTLSTAGNLVFEGSADGRFVAYRATDGKKLWESPVGTGVMAGPVTYQVDGEQYVAIAAGWGASFALSGGDAALKAGVRGGGRVLSFKLGGQAPIPPGLPPLQPVPMPSYSMEVSDTELELGLTLYSEHCTVCHGPMAVGGGSGVPDLRYSTEQTHEIFSRIVLDGMLEPAGMPKFDDIFGPDGARAIQAFILQQARAGAVKASAKSS